MRMGQWVVMTMAFALPSAVALAQPTPDAAAYAALAKLPEIAGLWEMTFGGGPRGAPPEGPSFTPAYAAKLKSYQEAQARDEIQASITDPEALTKPWNSTRVFGRHRDWTLAEYVCQQNNRNFVTEDGKSGINLKYEAQK